MRIRTVKPEFWTDEKLATVSELGCLFAVGLLNYADDEGYFNANPALIRAALFPLREPSIPIPVLLRELSGINYIWLASRSDGTVIGCVANFLKHQAINKPRPSKLKTLREKAGSTTGVLPHGMDQGTGNREQGREGEAPKTPPPLDSFGILEREGIDIERDRAQWAKDIAGLTGDQLVEILEESDVVPAWPSDFRQLRAAWQRRQDAAKGQETDRIQRDRFEQRRIDEEQAKVRVQQANVDALAKAKTVLAAIESDPGLLEGISSRAFDLVEKIRAATVAGKAAALWLGVLLAEAPALAQTIRSGAAAT